VADSALLVKSWLLQDATLIGMLGQMNVKAGELPAKFNPAGGPIVTVALHAGRSHPETIDLATDRVRVRVWAGVNQDQLAFNVYNEVRKWMHGANMVNLSPYGTIVISQEASRQSLTEPVTGWATVLAFYDITAHD
jgi:hypothetical protein